jgi:conjugative transfer signal peptidase TraF
MAERRDLLLMRCGDRLRAERRERLRLKRRLAIGTGGLTLIAATIVAPPAPRLLWNASASAPLGLYLVSPGSPLRRGDMVIARIPARWRSLAAERRYIPPNVPLVKRAAARAGDRVCANGSHILINGHASAIRQQRDKEGRPLPWWNGCATLALGSVFLLMPRPDSFDGRYFGPTQPTDIVGRAKLLWRA